VLLGLFVAGADASAPPTKPAEFTIMMWGNAPGTPAALKRAAECGFNIVGFASPGQLDQIQAAGLKAFVWPELDKVESLGKQIGNHAGLAGFVLGSEFSTAEFPEIAGAVAKFKEILPGKTPLLNLCPSYVYPRVLKAESYQDFLDRYVATCKPTMLCYDDYALMEDGSTASHFWNSLELIRGKALQSGIPFWNVVQASGHLNYRDPTAADLRFQAYATAAYGGKGIVYFTYKAYPVGNYGGTAVDQYGYETAAWQWLENTNHQIQFLGPTLMKLTSNAVYHFGDIPPSCHGPTANSLVKEVAGNVLVGDFTHEDGSRYVLLVSKDLHKNLICDPKFRDASTQVRKVSVYTGELIPMNYDEQFLSPGQGMLLKLVK
jgi:hypothetical protein